jgi:hypothetical protein
MRLRADGSPDETRAGTTVGCDERIGGAIACREIAGGGGGAQDAQGA